MQMKTSRLMWKPEPSPLDGPLRSEADVARHRRLYCGHYDRCLSQSVREGWGGFSCMHCPLRDQATQGLAPEPFADQRHSENLNQ